MKSGPGKQKSFYCCIHNKCEEDFWRPGPTHSDAAVRWVWGGGHSGMAERDGSGGRVYFTRRRTKTCQTDFCTSAPVGSRRRRHARDRRASGSRTEARRRRDRHQTRLEISAEREIVTFICVITQAGKQTSRLAPYELKHATRDRASGPTCAMDERFSAGSFGIRLFSNGRALSLF